MTTPPSPAPATGPRGPRSVVLAGGGTAGHVSPLLALADELRRRDPQVRITVLGTAAGLEARLVPQRGYDLRTIPKVVFPRKPSTALLRLPASLKGAVDAAGAVLDEVGADLVVGFGGYVSSPAYLAARRRGLPIVVHEQNVRPGLANRLGAALTPYVATTFAATTLRGARHLGMPLRREITGLDRAALRAEALCHFGLREDRPVVLVTGGSSGAKRLNDAFAARVRELSAAGVQVLHVTGRGKSFDPEPHDGAAYVVQEYCDRMDLAFAAADLVVSRAGAGMVCELTAVGLPAVYVPLPIGNGEQRFNVAEVVAAGGGLVVPDEQLLPEWVDQTLVPLVRDGDRLSRIAAAAQAVGTRDGDGRLADLVLEAAGARTAGARTAGAGTAAATEVDVTETTR
ncbi:undecaprenyldiphospho-muramoylpentapeptide beta-N-acetylglucosaminyltransferase [Arsenicicoccus dermatophilus]|uniref:undecaprenyldiphospho-muramoylpentapeptide beta-N-acetylglucosaminyltransferase n=1 Tax=Arsenicicoccus dermatophilus TaxID=1076331 RepID=UPI001F4CA9E1|nr:undecaprenyldiphospho-muramoylpentapeptide beta-N-acetylglucosaminyltransferase [Arsenicicoccus dermatophilus]MCH8613236.1 undecaprenyldiphospho-muramoylpentapeptide beta-N-acetylglucosaminyltransferase [Arsenicicoccus dermatophilus]